MAPLLKDTLMKLMFDALRIKTARAVIILHVWLHLVNSIRNIRKKWTKSSAKMLNWGKFDVSSC